MTIKRKRVNFGALVEVEADSEDTVDLNGTSDGNDVPGTAKSAKFSNTTVMKANNNLRLGVLQVRINGGVSEIRPKSVLSHSGYTNINNVVDNDLNTSALITTSGEITVDFGTIITNNIKAKIRHAVNSSVTTILFVSTDNITYTQVDSLTTNTDTTFTLDGGIQTYRYAKTNGGAPATTHIVFEIFEDTISSDATLNIRSTPTQDGLGGTILLSHILTSNTTFTFDSDILLTGNGEYFTLEIVSFSTLPFIVFLSNITSIREEI